MPSSFVQAQSEIRGNRSLSQYAVPGPVLPEESLGILYFYVLSWSVMTPVHSMNAIEPANGPF